MAPSNQMMRRYTRRTALTRAAGGLAAMSAGSAFLAACGSSSSGGGSSGTPSSMSAWWWGDPATMPQWLNASAAKFKAHTGVSLNVSQQQTQTLISAFTAAAAAKQGPDIAAQWAT